MSKHYIAPLSDNIERTSVFYKNGSLSNVGVKDRQIFVYPFSLF